jgi:hypothetical protein
MTTITFQIVNQNSLNTMRNYPAIIDRRCLCCSIAGLAVNVVLAKLPFGGKQSSKMAAANQEFLIVNGWVLTREDVAVIEMTPNVV